MREIKFRGRKPNGEWLYGDLVTTETTDGIPTKKEILPFDKAIFDVTEEVEEDTIGQFTGLYDENGEEIYEWDIVERFQPMPHYRNGVFYDGNAIYGVVRYIDAGFYILCENQAYELSRNFDMWVQGNIHDNPELLNK
jgi:uncharacterized phage protein (TIGR01671 family)